MRCRFCGQTIYCPESDIPMTNHLLEHLVAALAEPTRYIVTPEGLKVLEKSENDCGS